VLFEILINNCLRLHEKRASPPRRDLAIVDPRSRLVGLEISRHVNAVERAGPPSRAERKSRRIDFRLNSWKLFCFKDVVLNGYSNVCC
jgi:hypothetical protein